MDYDVWVSTAVFAACVLVYLAARGRGHPVYGARRLPARRTAIDRTTDVLHGLIGHDATTWRAYACVDRDDEALEYAWDLERTDVRDVEYLLWQCGIAGEWRARFVRVDDDRPQTVLLASNHVGQVTLADFSGCDPSLRPRWHDIAGATSGSGQPVVFGVPQSDDAVGTQWVGHTEVGDVDVETVVHLSEGAVVAIDRRMSVRGGDRAQFDRGAALRELAGGAALLVSTVAVLTGVVALALTTNRVDPTVPAVVAAVVLVAGIGADALGSEARMVQTYTDRTPPRVHLGVTWVTVLVISTLYAVVCFTSLLGVAAVGGARAPHLWSTAWSQVATGAVLGAAWLAVSAGGFALAARFGLARVMPAPARATLALDRYWTTRTALSSVVSGTVEECVYRGLLLTVVLVVTDNMYVSAVVSAVLWASMHSQRSVKPNAWRVAELTVVGSVLGVVAVQVGLLAVIAAHVGYNAVVQLSHDRRDRRSTVVPADSRVEDAA